MDFKKKKSNVMIVVLKKNCENNTHKSKTYCFHSSLAISNIRDILNNISEENKGDNKIQIRFQNMKTDKIDTFTITCCLTYEEIMNKIQDKLLSLKGVWDLKLTKYTLRVRNHQSKEHDSKIMSFNSKLKFETILVAIKKKFEIMEQEKDVMFLDENRKNKKSHTVTLRKDDFSKSFSVYMPNYASQELLEML